MKSLLELRDNVINKNISNPKVIAVAAAGDVEVLETIKLVNDLNLGTAILIGDEEKINLAAEKAQCDLQKNIVVNEPNDKEATEIAVEKVKSGEADIIMKGLLLTPTYLKAILNSTTGIKKSKFLHIATVMEIKTLKKLVVCTDMGMVIEPTLDEKMEMIKNTALIVRKMGISTPKVACLGAIETVSEKMKDTLESSILAKMAQRGQLGDVKVDGPLSFDLACYDEVKDHKGLISEVAGDPDIFIMPNIQAGNIFYKSMMHVADAKAGSIIMGTSKPAIITSRGDSPQTKLNSIALAMLMAEK